MIDTLIRPPRKIYRHAEIRMVGLTGIVRTAEYKLTPNGDAARANVIAETMRRNTGLREY